MVEPLKLHLENDGRLTRCKHSILANVLVCAKINRDKANGKYDKYVGYGDDREPNFRLVL